MAVETAGSDGATLEICNVRSGRVEDPRIFSVGPYGARLNFSAQQSRAFKLVSALVKKGPDFINSEILIIGAGLAGLSVARALREHKVTPVIYEKSGDILLAQTNSANRFIHPTINFWPEVELHQPTTCLPFMNWYPSAASNVISILNEKWEKTGLKVEIMTQVVDIRNGTKGDKNVVEVDVALSKDEVDTRIFDFVICCAGFGLERSDSDFGKPGYWIDTHQTIDKIRGALKKKQSIGVSGTGDGALIECISLAMNNPRAGKFIAKFFSMIKDEVGLRNELLRAEEASGEDRIAHYEKALTKIPSVAKAELDAGLMTQIKCDSGNSLVNLLAFEKDCLTLGAAAPIHKLIAMYAVKNDFINYKNIDTRLTPENLSDVKSEYGISVLLPRHGTKSILSDLMKGVDGFDDPEFKSRQEKFEFHTFISKDAPREPDIRDQASGFLVDKFRVKNRAFRIRGRTILIDQEYINENSPTIPSEYGSGHELTEKIEIYGFEVKFQEGVAVDVSS